MKYKCLFRIFSCFGGKASYSFSLGSNTTTLGYNRFLSETKGTRRIQVETKTRTHPVNVREPLGFRHFVEELA